MGKHADVMPLPQQCFACPECGPCMQEFEELHCVTGWPVLPTVDGVASLSPLQASVLVWEPDTEEAPPPAKSGFQKLGIRWVFVLAYSGFCSPNTALRCRHCLLLVSRRTLWIVLVYVAGRKHRLALCRFVKSTEGPSHPKLHRYVHPGNGKGFLAALLPLNGTSWTGHFASKGVTPEERRALRSVFLQVRLLRGNEYNHIIAVVACIHPGCDVLALTSGSSIREARSGALF